ncbi:hypothetical protein PoB_000547500 [Plakobranchus ocellatus]|uniref:Uncharacterized protein n=1 Tax=Plakobranchus ocellatus TaxID=259542 RepID=A0AAV3Y8Z7_9GAST|nr:hypothetical protein PoB_000547500 [Plakobranchus ocellatus]
MLPKFRFTVSPPTIPRSFSASVPLQLVPCCQSSASRFSSNYSQVFLCLCSPPVGSMLPKFRFSVSSPTIPRSFSAYVPIQFQIRFCHVTLTIVGFFRVYLAQSAFPLFWLKINGLMEVWIGHEDQYYIAKKSLIKDQPHQRISNGLEPRDRVGVSGLLSQLITLLLTPDQPENIKRAGTQRQSGGIRTSVSTDIIITDFSPSRGHQTAWHPEIEWDYQDFCLS